MEAETDVEEGAEACHDDGVKTQDRTAKTRNSYVLESQKAPDKKPNHGNQGSHSLCGSGALEKWPAHASMPDPCPGNVVLNKKGNIVLARPDAASSASKPKFLEQLEIFLYRELLYLGVSEMKPNELRMQAYREVFEYLIEDFKTYRPLLAAIKNEYELMLAYQRNEIKRLEPLRQLLVTVSEQSDRKVMTMRDQERKDIEHLQQVNEHLRHQVGELHELKTDLQAQIDRMQIEIAREYNAYRTECDARRLLVTDLNEMLAMREEARKKAVEDDLDLTAETADPTTLRIALRKAREDEMKSSQRLIIMEATYGDVIPKKDFEDLKKRYAEIEILMEITKDDIVILKSAYNSVIEEHKKLQVVMEESNQECEQLRRSATPRPRWDRCGETVAGGPERWKKLSDNKTSDQLVGLLLDEIANKASNSGIVEYFDALGLDNTVPAYLRFDAPVRNRHLCLRDTVLLITDIWREKTIRDAQRPDDPRMPLADFLLEYFTARFSLMQIVAEWGYNLSDACKRFAKDENVGLFYSILCEETDEEVEHDFMDTVADLLHRLEESDVAADKDGKVSRATFEAAVVGVFPHKTPERVTRLVEAATEQLHVVENNSFEYMRLFAENDERCMLELRHQFRVERVEYVDEITNNLGDAISINVDQLRDAVQTADPQIGTDQMEDYVCWAFQIESADDPAKPMQINDLAERLRHGSLRRCGSKS